MKKIEKITCYMPINLNLLMASTVNTTNNTITSTASAGPKTFSCPVEHCGQCIHENPRQIAEHIRKSHPKIAKGMGLNGNPGKFAFICKPCDAFTTAPHHHCFECEHPENGGKPRHFKTAAERDEHLKSAHFKWWLEYQCKHGSECHGKNGGCGFNHILMSQTYFDDITNLPVGLCRYERPWEGMRCKRDKCSFDHCWGRVRSDIKKAKGKTEFVANIVETCADCDDCVPSVVHVDEPEEA